MFFGNVCWWQHNVFAWGLRAQHHSKSWWANNKGVCVKKKKVKTLILVSCTGHITQHAPLRRASLKTCLEHMLIPSADGSIEPDADILCENRSFVLLIHSQTSFVVYWLGQMIKLCPLDYMWTISLNWKGFPRRQPSQNPGSERIHDLKLSDGVIVPLELHARVFISPPRNVDWANLKD